MNTVQKFPKREFDKLRRKIVLPTRKVDVKVYWEFVCHPHTMGKNFAVIFEVKRI